MKILLFIGILICLEISCLGREQLKGSVLWEMLCPIQKSADTTMALPTHPYKTTSSLKNSFRLLEGSHPNTRVSVVSDTGSMFPTLKFGDLLISERCSFEELEIGDVITFTCVEFREFDALTHRIVRINNDGAYIQTRGDLSKSRRVDSTVTTRENFVCRAIAKVDPKTAKTTFFR